MKKVFLFTGICFLMLAAPAWAENLQGTIREINPRGLLQVAYTNADTRIEEMYLVQTTARTIIAGTEKGSSLSIGDVIVIEAVKDPITGHWKASRVTKVAT